MSKINEKMKFEKFLFGVALNGWSVGKYSDGERVILVAEHITKPDAESKEFDSEDDYENWIDNIVDSETAIYNQAQAVRLVLDALEGK